MTETIDTTHSDPLVLDGLEKDEATNLLRTMLLIREFETRANQLALAGKVPGGVHSSAGQEAVAVGVASAISDGDHVAGTHRSHHHALALGIAPDTLMAELFGKATGCNGGRGGSMHVADLRLGFIGGNGIVGAGVGLAMGVALAFKFTKRRLVAVGYVGDGGANTGRTWEAINLAVVWNLPLVVICENNLYAVETATSSVMASESIVERARGFGIRAVAIDGQDIQEVRRAASAALDDARSGNGPTFIEARTYRFEGHNTGQVINYRTDDEVAAWRGQRDPIARLRHAMVRRDMLTDADASDLTDEVRRQVDDAVAFAEASPWPDPRLAFGDVTSSGETVRRLA